MKSCQLASAFRFTCKALSHLHPFPCRVCFIISIPPHHIDNVFIFLDCVYIIVTFPLLSISHLYSPPPPRRHLSPDYYPHPSRLYIHVINVILYHIHVIVICLHHLHAIVMSFYYNRPTSSSSPPLYWRHLIVISLRHIHATLLSSISVIFILPHRHLSLSYSRHLIVISLR